MPRKTLKRGSKRVQTFIQEDDNYCGPATAKSVLKWLGVSRTQDTLWDAITDAADALGLPLCEACMPDCEPGEEPEGCPRGMCRIWSSWPEALHSAVASLTKAPMKLVRETDPAITDHAIVWSLVNDIPAIALVMGHTHWVVVHGYNVDHVPTSINDTSYTLLGFYLIDPQPITGPARFYADADHWRFALMTGVTCGRHDGQFIAVCDPETRTQGGPTVPQRSAKRVTRTTLLPAARMSSAALDGIRRADLVKDEVWRAGLAGTRPGAPRIVQRLDRPNSFYALVPLEKGRKVMGHAMVDPYSGVFMGAGVTEDLKKGMRAAVSPDDAIELLSRTRVSIPGLRPNMKLRPEGLSASATLVWKPCAESLTPYAPFTRVMYGEHVVYVRADGEVFTKLTPAAGGS